MAPGARGGRAASAVEKAPILGLGPMGAPTDRHLPARGYELTVRNRTPGKAGPPAEAGAVLAPSPAEAVRDAHLVSRCRPPRRRRGLHKMPV
ncbi:NAD(P)-binding domain-containing protein [Streptomyces virginiae]